MQARMDAPLTVLAQQSGGDLRNMLGAFFSFLNRKTDFYLAPHPDDIVEAGPTGRLKMGFKEGDAEKLLIASFRQFPLRRLPKGAAVKPAPARAPESSRKEINSKENSSSNVEVADKKSNAKSCGTGTDTNSSKVEKKSDDIDNFEVRLTEEGKQIPVGNGGSSIKCGYHWTQTIEEISIVIPLEKSIRGKDLNVNIRNSTIDVEYKQNKKKILDGHFFEKINTSESTWSIEGNVLLIVLEKLQKSWWGSALEGDEEIDTSLIDSKRKIEEYDDVTQGAIRKIMFDQDQQRKGLPTSDEILGVKPKIPSSLPSGVEFIDSETLDKHAEAK